MTVFPARAGMNRKALADLSRRRRVPRTRGDEPGGGVQFEFMSKCSPHARG